MKAHICFLQTLVSFLLLNLEPVTARSSSLLRVIVFQS